MPGAGAPLVFVVGAGRDGRIYIAACMAGGLGESETVGSAVQDWLRAAIALLLVCVMPAKHVLACESNITTTLRIVCSHPSPSVLRP
jgi:hypothetical protein